MKRRSFIKDATAGAIAFASVGAMNASTALGTAARRPSGKLRMYVGCQSQGSTDDGFAFLARCGVYHCDPGMPKSIPGIGWDLADSQAMVERAAKYGIAIDAYHLPLTSAGIDKVATPNIMLGKSPERDREIEMIQQMITVAARSGVKLLLYNTTILPILRTGTTVDRARGNVRCSTWNYAEAQARGANKGLTKAGVVDADTMFERITYLLDRLLPVAEQHGVRLANHIADPPVPADYRGIMRWNSPDVFAGIKRFAQLYDSPSHGFNFCIGSTAEGLRDPRKEIIPILRWVGKRGQLFNIHYRNIRGGLGNFQEVFPDNGDMDFVQVMRVLQEVDYAGMVMPDHVPSHEDPAARKQAFAFCYGYIKALIQMLET